MGLISSLNNAVSGIRVNQDSLNVVSRNIANSGTPGYHRQSLNVIDHGDNASSYARSAGINRAFNQSLQTYYTRQVSDAASAGVEASYLDRLQIYMGKPGSPGSLDTVYHELHQALEALAVSPDDHVARAEVVGSAQAMAGTLNRLSGNIQAMREETETQMAASVDSLNDMLTSLTQVNQRLVDGSVDEDARAMMLDRRDSLVSQIAEKLDVRVDYRADDTVALATRSGISLISGNRAATLSFESSGPLPNGMASNGAAIMVNTPGGREMDLLAGGGMQKGELAALVNLRDHTLVDAQRQLDDVAASLALTFNSNVVAGAEVDLSDLKPGNDILVNYREDGVGKQLRIVNTEEAMDYVDASGVRVVGVDMSADAGAVASALEGLGDLGGLDFANPAGDTLRVVATGTTTTIDSVLARSTSDDTQDDGFGLNLFMDGSSKFTDTLDTDPPQRVGLAGRISVTGDIIDDNRLLVQYEPNMSLGDSARPDYLLEQLQGRSFASAGDPFGPDSTYKLSGTLGEMVTQTINNQGRSVAASLGRQQDATLALDAVTQQMQSEYGVNLDEEMARLVELQNVYAANARVISVVQELLQRLMNI